LKDALTAAMLAIATIFAASSAHAQTYDPNYPVCLQVYAPRAGGYISCSFASLAQCQATASGRSAECYANPVFTLKEPPRRVHRKRYHDDYR
jgi:Protein of unknown function (DUF3551)